MISSIFTFSQVKSKIETILSELPSSTKLAINIIDGTNGKTIYSKNSDRPMIPASNTKLFTTAAALYIMGPKYELTTKIFTDDFNIDNGIVNGNIYIKGFGNSTFTTKDLDSLVKLLVIQGIKKINGNIIGDDTYFDNLYTRDDWIVGERANVKLPPVSALVINKNQFVISFRSNGKIGTKLKYKIKPDASFINVNMKAKVKKFRSRPRISTRTTKNKINITVKGGLRKRRSQRSYVVNISNPPLYFALLMKEKLQKKGIKVLGNAEIGETPVNRIELASIGIFLDDLISHINKNSNNYLAECLFKALGAYYSGEQGNSFYATQAILSTFEDEQIIDDATVVVDGSGISRFNTITTGSIGRLLYKIYKDEFLFENFYKSLSISGIDGTLKDRRINNFIIGNFHGKTGTLNGVSALSGYLTTKNNNIYIVSIIMEYKYGGSSFHKNIEDKLLIALSK